MGLKAMKKFNIGAFCAAATIVLANFPVKAATIPTELDPHAQAEQAAAKQAADAMKLQGQVVSESKDIGVLAPEIKSTQLPLNKVEIVPKITAYKPRLIVALSGGGCKAIGQIGVLRSLEEHHIKIDGIVGTSMGATIGGLYAAGVPLDDIEEMFLSGRLQRHMFKGVGPRVAAMPFDPLCRAVGIKAKGGWATGKSFQKYLAKDGMLPAHFSDLKIPFACVATNLMEGKSDVLATGDLRRAIVASNCIPIFCRPIQINGQLYVDGGIKANLPSTLARGMHPDILLAALADAPIKPQPKEHFDHKRAVLGRVVDIMLANADRSQVASSDILIYPDVDGIEYLTTNADVLRKGIASGKAAMDAVIDKLETRMVAKKQ